jgi:hypothetical protein
MTLLQYIDLLYHLNAHDGDSRYLRHSYNHFQIKGEHFAWLRWDVLQPVWILQIERDGDKNA